MNSHWQLHPVLTESSEGKEVFHLQLGYGEIKPRLIHLSKWNKSKRLKVTMDNADGYSDKNCSQWIISSSNIIGL